MRRSGRRTPAPSHKSFCFRTGDPGFTSGVDGWAPSWGFFWSSAFGLVCAAAGDWSLELRPGGGVWLNAVDAKNQRKKAQRRVIDLPLSQNAQARGWPFAGNAGNDSLHWATFPPGHRAWLVGGVKGCRFAPPVNLLVWICGLKVGPVVWDLMDLITG